MVSVGRITRLWHPPVTLAAALVRNENEWFDNIIQPEGRKMQRYSLNLLSVPESAANPQRCDGQNPM